MAQETIGVSPSVYFGGDRVTRRQQQGNTYVFDINIIQDDTSANHCLFSVRMFNMDQLYLASEYTLS
jgi:hypothetical protein